MTPAGITSRKTGNCRNDSTAATMKGSASVIRRICQAPATSVIQNAVRDRTLDNHSAGNPGRRNGASNPGECSLSTRIGSVGLG